MIDCIFKGWIVDCLVSGCMTTDELDFLIEQANSKDIVELLKEFIDTKKEQLIPRAKYLLAEVAGGQ